MEACNVEPYQTVMIGDRLDNDIYPAKQVGMRTIWIKQGFGGNQEPVNENYRADITIDSLDQLLDVFQCENTIEDKGRSS